MVEFRLTDEQLLIKNLAREFADKKVRPALSRYDKASTPNDRVPWEIIEEGWKIGLKNLMVPEKYGGTGSDPLTSCMVLEELSAADGGIGLIFNHFYKEVNTLVALCSESQKQEVLSEFVKNPRCLLANAITEASSGTDNILPYPDHTLNTHAEQRGNHFVINGTKQFISNANEAKYVFLFASTDKTKNFLEGTSMFLVPRDAPGIEITHFYNKVGLRCINNVDITFNDCKIPKECLVGGLNMAFSESVVPFFALGHVYAGAIPLGMAQGAYEIAQKYCRERIQGGRPIIEHQAVGMRLARMLTEIEAARNLVWKAAWSLTNEKIFDHKLASMGKYFAADVCYRVCTSAMELMGGSGVMEEVAMEKCMRDALCVLHLDGTQDVQLLQIQKELLRSG
ncbi:MAG: acyl-CoA/acyl-ACP dehydrogenase [Thaumarchaeota archaeon]|nr:acyl-CoA/acyl-ACP dehydrogenase [Nitrososphaerota archaeon]MCL5067404.1 acyl-CoA/acyl-ACP dehydrogenase [Nitrososphaerota archaeon]